MDTVKQLVVICIALGCVYGAPANATGNRDVENLQHKGMPKKKEKETKLTKMKNEKTYDVDGQTLTENMEQTDDGTIIDVEAQLGSTALTVFTDVTHGLLVHRYNTEENSYISSLADYNDTRSAQGNLSAVFKYRLEPVSEINRQYFIYTATDLMKRVCSDAKNILWSEIHADDEQETRQKRGCKVQCSYWCWWFFCSRSCRCIC